MREPTNRCNDDTGTYGNRFTPECLTVNLRRSCNLRCAYCFSKSSPETGETHSRSFIRASIAAAAGLVAASCVVKKRKLYFGFQGLGEPLANFDLLRDVVEDIENVGKRHGLGKYAFITSNGTYAPERYRWVARHFERICLSVDGPPSIHDVQRPFPDGGPSLALLKRTLAVLRDEGCVPVCRATITPLSVSRQVEAVDFLCADLGFTDVQFEPVFTIGDETGAGVPCDLFAEQLMASRERARSLGCRLTYSGYRETTKHGPYCTVCSNVLLVDTEGKASACMFSNDSSKKGFLEVGRYDEHADTFLLDHDRIDRLASAALSIPPECADCTIRFHCVKGCPDRCVLIDGKARLRNSTRCRINRLLLTHGW
jgi:radical SAM protein with 4Fe4S-binding SPASM domain